MWLLRSKPRYSQNCLQACERERNFLSIWPGMLESRNSWHKSVIFRSISYIDLIQIALASFPKISLFDIVNTILGLVRSIVGPSVQKTGLEGAKKDKTKGRKHTTKVRFRREFFLEDRRT